MPKSLREWLAHLAQRHSKSIDLGLERVAAVAHALALDQIQIPLITVGGTNGKGSCVATLEAIYLAQGYKVGCYSSPHLVRFNERIRISGEEVSDNQLVRAFEQIEAGRGSISLSYFEFTTLAALQLFGQTELDLTILEVGLGGRLDAVNILDADVAVVTSIGIDHTEYLGQDITSIATEKAGIFRAHKPVVCGQADPPEALLERARSLECPLYIYARDFGFDSGDGGTQWFRSDLTQGHQRLQIPKLNLRPSTVACALQIVMLMQQKLPVEASSLATGAQKQLLGRFTIIHDNPLQVVDVAHNQPAIEALFDKLHEVYQAGGNLHVLFSMLKDKQIASSIAAICPMVHCWHITPLDDPRSSETVALRKIIQNQAPLANVVEYTSVVEGWRGAEQALNDKDCLLAFGSFVLVGALLEYFTQSRRIE